MRLHLQIVLVAFVCLLTAGMVTSSPQKVKTYVPLDPAAAQVQRAAVFRAEQIEDAPYKAARARSIERAALLEAQVREVIAQRAEAKRRAAIKKHVFIQGPAVYGTGACGGSLPPCWVMGRESKGNLTIYNQQGSGASGKWQFMPGTWGGYGGYANAADAPEDVQDAKAVEVWAGGDGCSHWAACG